LGFGGGCGGLGEVVLVAGGYEVAEDGGAFLTTTAEMTVRSIGWERNWQRQRQQQEQMRGFFATLRMTSEGILSLRQAQGQNDKRGIFAAAKIAHLSDDETVAKMGHPVVVSG